MSPLSCSTKNMGGERKSPSALVSGRGIDHGCIGGVSLDELDSMQAILLVAIAFARSRDDFLVASSKTPAVLISGVLVDFKFHDRFLLSHEINSCDFLFDGVLYPVLLCSPPRHWPAVMTISRNRATPSRIGKPLVYCLPAAVPGRDECKRGCESATIGAISGQLGKE